MGKGIGFGKKVSERVDAPEDVRIYSLKNVTEQGKSKEFVRDIPPECFEISNQNFRFSENLTNLRIWGQSSKNWACKVFMLGKMAFLFTNQNKMLYIMIFNNNVMNVNKSVIDKNSCKKSEKDAKYKD